MTTPASRPIVYLVWGRRKSIRVRFCSPKHSPSGINEPQMAGSVVTGGDGGEAGWVPVDGQFGPL